MLCCFPGSSFYSGDLVLSIEFFPGVEPSLATPLWVRFGAGSPSTHGDGVAAAKQDPSGGGASLAVNATGQDVALAHLGFLGGGGEASLKVLVHAFDLPPGAYILEARLGAHWHAPVSQQTVSKVHFTLLDFYAAAVAVDPAPRDARAPPPFSEAATAEAAAAAAAAPAAPACHLGWRGRDAPLVVDAFPFFNELDVLEARFHELEHVVCVANAAWLPGPQRRCVGFIGSLFGSSSFFKKNRVCASYSSCSRAGAMPLFFCLLSSRWTCFCSWRAR